MTIPCCELKACKHADRQVDIQTSRQIVVAIEYLKNLKVSKNQIYVKFLCNLIVLSKPFIGAVANFKKTDLALG